MISRRRARGHSVHGPAGCQIRGAQHVLDVRLPAIGRAVILPADEGAALSIRGDRRRHLNSRRGAHGESVFRPSRRGGSVRLDALHVDVATVGAHVAPCDQRAAGAIGRDRAVGLWPPPWRVAGESGFRRKGAHDEPGVGPTRRHRPAGREVLRIDLLVRAIHLVLPRDDRPARAVGHHAGRALVVSRRPDWQPTVPAVENGIGEDAHVHGREPSLDDDQSRSAVGTDDGRMPIAQVQRIRRPWMGNGAVVVVVLDGRVFVEETAQLEREEHSAFAVGHEHRQHGGRDLLRVGRASALDESKLVRDSIADGQSSHRRRAGAVRGVHVPQSDISTVGGGDERATPQIGDDDGIRRGPARDRQTIARPSARGRSVGHQVLREDDVVSGAIVLPCDERATGAVGGNDRIRLGAVDRGDLEARGRPCRVGGGGQAQECRGADERGERRSAYQHALPRR